MRSFVADLVPRMLLGVSRFRNGMTLGVRGAVFDAEERVFLVRHSYVPGWYLPGGGVEPGETLAEALARELKEEGGIILDQPAELFGLYLNRRLSARDHVALFVSRAWRQEAEPRVPNREIVDFGFFAAAALPEATTTATRQRLAEIRGEAAVSPEW